MKKHFVGWVILFFVLLSIIPVFILLEWVIAAKFVGIITVIALSVALWSWRIQLSRKAIPFKRVVINLNDQYWLKDHCSFYRDLSSKEKRIFEDRMGLFLAGVKMYSDNSRQLLKQECFCVAGSYIICNWQSTFNRTFGISKVIFSDNNDGICEIIKSSEENILFIDSVMALKQLDNKTDNTLLSQVWLSM